MIEGAGGFSALHLEKRMEAPAPRLPQLPLVPLGLLGLGIAGAIVAQAQAREGLRLLGFWVYVSIVNGGPQNAGDVFEAYREAGGKDRVEPYWGVPLKRLPSGAAAQRLAEAVASAPLAGLGQAGQT